MNSSPALPSGLALRFAAIFAPLAVLVAARFRVLGVWTVPVHIRLIRIGRRFAGLLAARGVPRARLPGDRASHGAPPLRLPPGHAWLLERLRHEAAHFTQCLESLLAEPAVIAELAAAPAALRALRPFCRLLGVSLPPCLQPPRPVLPSPPRLGRIDACPSSAHPRPLLPRLPPRRPSPPLEEADGCYCANPSASPRWPFPRAFVPP